MMPKVASREERALLENEEITGEGDVYAVAREYPVTFL
jgi:hypothetical protein